MSYVDMFACAVPNDAKDAFAAHVAVAADAFIAAGALATHDAWGEDVPDGRTTSFPMAVKAEAGETVCVGWVLWPSRAARDEGWTKAMKDPRFTKEGNPMPFDGARLIHGGFETLHARAADG